MSVKRLESETHRSPISCCHRWLFGGTLRQVECVWVVSSQIMTRRGGRCTLLLDAEHEVQRAIKRAELTACFCHLRRIIGVITAHVDHRGIVDGLWKGKIEVHWPESKGRRSVGLIGEEVRRMHRQETLLEVEHFKAHRSKTEKQELSLFERSVTEGNERADESGKRWTLCDGGEMAQIRASAVQQKREEVHSAFQCAAKFHCLVEE